MKPIFPVCLIIAASVPFMFACGPTRPIGGGGQGGTAGTAGTGGSSGTNIPCDVQAILTAKCATCHANPPQFGAPMPLVTYADTQASRSGQPTYKLMQTRIGNGTMPPNTTLTQAEKDTLNNWFNAGAPGSTQVCTGSIPGDEDKIGPEYLPCSPAEQIRMVSYSGAEGSGIKYNVGPGVQTYINLNFANPFKTGGARQGQLVIASAPITDNKTVIHHWILYGNSSLGQTHVAGWAPGGTNTVADPDIGQDLSGYTNFTMQIHYNNATAAAQQDASGVAFCATSEPRTYKAGVFTLGQYSLFIPAGAQNFAAPPAVCNVQRPMTIIGTSPHMHKIGVGFRTEHIRNGVSLGDLSYIPNGGWSFEGQKHYKTVPRREVQVGDILRTTCYYSNPTANTVTFGPFTENEMCFDFMSVIPYGPELRSCNGGATP